MVFICLYVIYLHEVSTSQHLLEQVKIDSKKFFKCRDDNRDISNNLNIGMAGSMEILTLILLVRSLFYLTVVATEY